MNAVARLPRINFGLDTLLMVLKKVSLSKSTQWKSSLPFHSFISEWYASLKPLLET